MNRQMKRRHSCAMLLLLNDNTAFAKRHDSEVSGMRSGARLTTTTSSLPTYQTIRLSRQCKMMIMDDIDHPFDMETCYINMIMVQCDELSYGHSSS